MTLQSAPCGAGVGLEILPDPWGPDLEGKQEKAGPPCTLFPTGPCFGERLTHKKTGTKRQTLSPFSICLHPCLCLMSQSIGILPVLCLITSASYPISQGLRNGFYKFHLLKTQCFYSLSLQFSQVIPCAWMKLQEETCFPHSGNF